MSNGDVPSRSELHDELAHYYADKLTELADEASYATWYSIENKVWQEYETEWLYHLSQLEDRDEARLQMARSFFRAFWWWGYYIRFDYCEQSLGEFWAAARDAVDARLVQLLRSFHSSYPTGYRKPSTPGTWREVQRSLVELREMLGLEGDRCQLEREEQRLTRGITSLFLAHSCRYIDPKDTNTDKHYGDAYGCFSADHDIWDLGWTTFEMADLMVERGFAEQASDDGSAVEECLERSEAYLNEAAGYVETLLRDPDDDPDHELLGHLHRVYADRYWLAEEWRGAFESYGRAVQHAYLFNGTPEPCDPYTRQFYVEMVERTCERLAELSRAMPVMALRECMELRQAAPEPLVVRAETRSVEAALRDYDRDPDRRLQVLLFPAPPTERDCTGTAGERSASAFMRRWDAVASAQDLAALMLRKGSPGRHSDL